MTVLPETPGPVRIVALGPEGMRARLTEALGIYVSAMRYPPSAVHQRASTWMSHISRPGWRAFAALRGEDMVGVAYGYLGGSGQWWYEQVLRGLTESGEHQAAAEWLADYFELTELHVSPAAQGRGTGERLLRALLGDLTCSRVLLSTPEGPSRAWRLYRRMGFEDVLRHHRFAGDPRPFAVLGRPLPL
ncbi:GNAT family N-acetyltransferase [Actinoalloteichus spitiensis]|uniref:GNAT family N-acetyltransferase n=1 Tax=Actinoalloteichus spitiensis TaxID=252394 RepID=UPI00037EF443